MNNDKKNNEKNKHLNSIEELNEDTIEENDGNRSCSSSIS